MVVSHRLRASCVAVKPLNQAFNIISILREFANFDDFSLVSRLTTVFNFSDTSRMLCVHRSATSPEELAKCKEMLPIFTRVNATNPWTCVQEADSDACVEAVGLGTADVMVVGARDIVLAAERYGTQLVLAEARGVGAEAKPSKSYALAVVHKDTDMSQGWESLRGKRSCHT
eukprot:19989-Heterococcus_DN1.PRE.2